MTGTDTVDLALSLRRDVRGSLEAFSQTASTSLNLAAGLAVLCHGVARGFGASSVSAWLHDRRQRELVLSATSGESQLPEGWRLPADGEDLPARVMRDSGLQHRADPGHPWRPHVLGVPLRGRRRALGALLLEGLRAEAAEQDEVREEADELGRQLSAAIENLLLLEDVLRSRRELAHTFDSLEDLVAICDPRLRVVHVNRTLCDRARLTRDRLIDRPLQGVLGPEAAAWVASVPLDHLASVSTFAREIEDPQLGGRFTMTLTPLAGPDSPLNGVVFVARDVTTQARLEAEREALRERLTQSEKLAALGQFVAGIAHELNNPLQAVIGHLELLRHEGRVPADIQREISLVFREADRAARIVDNLLVFAGRRRVPRRRVNVGLLLGRVLARRTAACRGAGIHMTRESNGALPPVLGNRVLLEQAVMNILLNAEQAVAGRPGRIGVSASADAGASRVMIAIRDNGPGIPDSVLPRVFEPFFTTKEVGQGNGLGLALTYGIVTDHGGTVSASNHPDGGAVFTIELPAAPPVEERLH
jgi:signal transduction histidine kinase